MELSARAGTANKQVNKYISNNNYKLKTCSELILLRDPALSTGKVNVVSGEQGTSWRWTAERDPQMHMMEERSREKLSLHLSQWMVLL